MGWESTWETSPQTTRQSEPHRALGRESTGINYQGLKKGPGLACVAAASSGKGGGREEGDEVGALG